MRSATGPAGGDAAIDRIAQLDYVFGDAQLLSRALTHRSAGRANNERLEFLGDAVLGVVVSEALYQKFPRASEGILTRLRAELVREATLADIARSIQLGDALALGPGELRSGGFRRDSILADAFEALIGAMYLDGGLERVRAALAPLFDARMAALDDHSPKDAKTELQEWLQGRALALPVYELAGTTGDDHRKTFFVRCRLEALGLSSDGEGGSRRAAETHAAQLALAQLAARKIAGQFP